MTARRATQFYSAKASTLCDICEEEDCGESCEVKASKRISERSENIEAKPKPAADAKDASSQLSSPAIILALIAITKMILRI